MSNAAWFCDEVCPCIDRIVAVNPEQFQVIRQSVKKTDRNDALTLAFFLSTGMLPETRLKSVAESGLASRVQTRDSFVKNSTLLLNRIHALHNRRRTKLKKEGLASQKKLLALDSSQFTPFEHIELDTLREQTLNLTTALTKLDGAIEAATEKMDGFNELTSIKGVKERSTAILLSSIGNMDTLASADKLMAYMYRGSANQCFTKRGNKLMRTMLVQCTLIAIRYSDLNSFYRRIKERRIGEYYVHC
ncbi:MAG: transposase [Alphaproteobacteria bacterium]|nr:transposase [Alphaproteobacteria bacterium]